MNTANHTRFIKQTASRFGFDYCGIARAEQLGDDARRLERWLMQGMHAGMGYMENHFELRIDPRKLVPGARSVITVLQNYYPPVQQRPDAPKISKYAYGKDYHGVVKNKLHEFLASIRAETGEINGRGFIDSAPVLERAWAQKSGLGWIGKNGNLLTAKNGSFFFIATLVVDLALDYDDPYAKDFCGSCRRCIDACPTGAIGEEKVVDGSKCISYFTIELKEMLIPEVHKDEFNNWMFGCDTCQDVCPWNRFSKPHHELQLSPLPEILNLTSGEWEALSEEAFKKIFKDSPLRRSKWAGIKRNIKFLQGN